MEKSYYLNETIGHIKNFVETSKKHRIGGYVRFREDDFNLDFLTSEEQDYIMDELLKDYNKVEINGQQFGHYIWKVYF